MVRTPLRIAALLLVTCLVVALGAGCDEDTADAPPPQPWRFQSEAAPYAIEIPGEWQKTDSGELNDFADLAVTLADSYFLIVIPQELPQYEGVAAPDAKAIKRASLALLRERIDKFEIERTGPLKLGDQTALSIFAEGLYETDPVQYIATYATRGPWGYQIVAWGPQEEEDQLIAATDALLSGWKFTSPAPSTPSPADEGEPPTQPK
ncbi:hypothetical protein FIV42_27050 [Persicimonas caeni]|uniref:DUF1795 domain-containing protein n=1 Tax=Persicimonas caeni TaxID=2292766 RepID=A0A4Y6Q1E8_PERCE|nr:hypothetical protein [Persicimonas caeni]QDG54269.1 hypothetical protein FIV42_27050 [Persicimonas caeni]QED35490.1 hypothetical protein FRD00_27045 [Persicimonas caeni]